MAMSDHELLAKMMENVGNALLENARLLRATPAAAHAPAPAAEGVKRKRGAAGAPKKKRARTAYNFFITEQFEIAKQSGGDKPAKEMLKELGAKWAALSADAKAPYEARAVKEKQELEASQSAGALPAPGAASSGATSTPSGSQAMVPAVSLDEAAAKEKKKKKKKKDKEERRKKKKERQMAAA